MTEPLNLQRARLLAACRIVEESGTLTVVNRDAVNNWRQRATTAEAENQKLREALVKMTRKLHQLDQFNLAKSELDLARAALGAQREEEGQ